MSKYLSIVVPVKVETLDDLHGFKDCYQALSHIVPLYDAEIIVVDTSPITIFLEMENWFTGTHIKHVIPERRYVTGANDKLNSIEAAIDVATGEYVMVLDDDCRPDEAFVDAISKELLAKNPECFRCLVHYNKPHLISLMNLASILFVNMTCSDMQFWGMIGFKKSSIKRYGFPCKNGLFDEKSIEGVFRANNAHRSYINAVSLEMYSTTSYKKYLHQRVRYSYENLVYPVRFYATLAILPLAVISYFDFGNFLGPLLILGTACSYVTAIAFLGQFRYGAKMPKYTFLFAPLWFAPYIVCNWIALGAYALGGVSFGGRKIRQVA